MNRDDKRQKKHTKFDFKYTTHRWRRSWLSCPKKQQQQKTTATNRYGARRKSILAVVCVGFVRYLIYATRTHTHRISNASAFYTGSMLNSDVRGVCILSVLFIQSFSRYFFFFWRFKSNVRVLYSIKVHNLLRAQKLENMLYLWVNQEKKIPSSQRRHTDFWLCFILASFVPVFQ